MTITRDELAEYICVSREIFARLERFIPLFRKKHEAWTYEAYRAALDDLSTMHGEVFAELHDLIEPKKPTQTVTPFRRG